MAGCVGTGPLTRARGRNRSYALGFCRRDYRAAKSCDVYAGERITHAVMGILYGGMIAYLIPVLLHWWSLPSTLVLTAAPVQDWLRYALLLMELV